MRFIQSVNSWIFSLLITFHKFHGSRHHRPSLPGELCSSVPHRCLCFFWLLFLLSPLLAAFYLNIHTFAFPPSLCSRPRLFPWSSLGIHVVNLSLWTLDSHWQLTPASVVTVASGVVWTCLDNWQPSGWICCGNTGHGPKCGGGWMKRGRGQNKGWVEGWRGI